MSTFNKDTTEATPRGSGGGLQSKALPDMAQPKGAGGVLQGKAIDAATPGAPQQPEVEHGPEASDQTPAPPES
jgi:hypothetical protein